VLSKWWIIWNISFLNVYYFILRWLYCTHNFIIKDCGLFLCWRTHMGSLASTGKNFKNWLCYVQVQTFELAVCQGFWMCRLMFFLKIWKFLSTHYSNILSAHFQQFTLNSCHAYVGILHGFIQLSEVLFIFLHYFSFYYSEWILIDLFSNLLILLSSTSCLLMSPLQWIFYFCYNFQLQNFYLIFYNFNFLLVVSGYTPFSSISLFF
jgi:hypothetical protein